MLADEAQTTEIEGTTTTAEPRPGQVSGSERLKKFRRGKRAISMYLPEKLVARVNRARAQQRRSLTTFVEMALENSVELAERFSPRRPKARRRKAG
jgi:hypothetical protein